MNNITTHSESSNHTTNYDFSNNRTTILRNKSANDLSNILSERPTWSKIPSELLTMKTPHHTIFSRTKEMERLMEKYKDNPKYIIIYGYYKDIPKYALLKPFIQEREELIAKAFEREAQKNHSKKDETHMGKTTKSGSPFIIEGIPWTSNYGIGWRKKSLDQLDWTYEG